MTIDLICVGEGLQDHYHLTKFPAVIGRSPDADLNVTNSWASPFHCEVTLAGGTPVVRDLSSRHGTILNGVCVGEARLAHGDKLTVGLSTFEVSFERPAIE